MGFRRGPDTWMARYRGRDRKQQWHPLGEVIEYDEAKRRAEAWISQMVGAAVRATKRSTVKAALEAYLADLRLHGRADAAKGRSGGSRSTSTEIRWPRWNSKGRRAMTSRNGVTGIAPAGRHGLSSVNSAR